jgi:protein SCO1/2/putative membrane protein
MARLQEKLHKDGLDDVILVSFSVNPETDTPEVLRSYAEGHGADAERWLFLTGKSDADVFSVAKGFLLPAQRTEGRERTRGNEVTHSPRLVLVDREGRIRGYFDGRQVDEEGGPVDDLPALEREITRLHGGFDFPTLNAFLNGMCALLLSAGYVAVRRQWIALHKACMLTALTVSAVFLASYLYYHIVVRGGQPTHFSGPSEVRAVYLGILLTHTVLAALVAPLALVTATLGLAGWIRGHRRLARVVLPIWLYVSVTGVVVYWMLYHLYPAA